MASKRKIFGPPSVFDDPSGPTSGPKKRSDARDPKAIDDFVKQLKNSHLQATATHNQNQLAQRAREAAETHKNERDLYIAFMAFAFAQETNDADAWEVASDAFGITDRHHEDSDFCREMAILLRAGKNPRAVVHEGALCILHDEPGPPP